MIVRSGSVARFPKIEQSERHCAIRISRHSVHDGRTAAGCRGSGFHPRFRPTGTAIRIRPTNGVYDSYYYDYDTRFQYLSPHLA